jgi:1-acyl-sn-glycerol-3-phosphate acyltransferase
MIRFRFFCLVLHLLMGLFMELVIWPFMSRATRIRTVCWFSKRLLSLMHVRVCATSDAPDLLTKGPYLIYANHVSWLDIFAINAIHPATFIAKSEIEAWPIAGTLAKRAGTLFIERGKRHAVRDVIAAAAKVLRAGERVAVFPEGTTGTGRAPMPFHSNFVQAAIQASTPVLPLSIQFFDMKGEFTDQPAFVGEQTFMDNVRFLLKHPQGFEVRVHFHKPLAVDGLTRHEVSQQAFEAIARRMAQGRGSLRV